MNNEWDNSERRDQRLKEIRAEYNRRVADSSLDPKYRKQLTDLESLYVEPPTDPDLAALWLAYGPFRSIDDNPVDTLAGILFPNSTPESIAERWRRIRLEAQDVEQID